MNLEAIMTKLRFDLPPHLAHLSQSQTGRLLDLELHHSLMPGVSAEVLVQYTPANPDLFYVYVVPKLPLAELKTNYHYFSAILPAVSREMFDDFAVYADFICKRIARLREAIMRGDLRPIGGATAERDEAIRAFAADCPI